MPLLAVLALVTILAALDAIAFAGLRLALGARMREGRGRAAAWTYWAVSGLALTALVVLLLARQGEDEAPVAGVVLVAAVAMYLPKAVLGFATILEFIQRAAGRFLGVLRRRPRGPASGWPTRTRILPRVGLGLALATFAAVAWGATLGRTDVAVYRHVSVVPSLPARLDGLRVVHLSDIHVASLGSSGPRLADRIVAAVNAEHPDIVAFTGDYGEPADFVRGPEILGRLEARLGKFAVLGNHDFGGREKASDNWSSPDDKRRKVAALASAFGSRGFALLVNDAVTVSREAEPVTVLGVGVFDPHHGYDDADLAATERRAAAGGGFRLLLAHSPEYWEQFVEGRQPIDVTLTGHTHGAQVGVGVRPLVWSPAALQFRRWGGLYRTGSQSLNVNRGMGYVGLPVRLNMPADISVIVLRAVAQSAR